MKFLNKYIMIGAAALTLSLGMTSCTDYLDKAPESDISDTDAYKDFHNFQGFVEELYYCQPDPTNGYWTNSWNWGEDEIMNINVNYHMCYKVDQGDFWGWQSEFDGWQSGWMDRASNETTSANGPDRFKHSMWPLAWYGIRKANMGIENLDKITATKEEKDLIAGQLYFFRGWFHFMLMQYFGGLPYIDSVLPAGEKLTLPRLSYAECAEKAAADFRKAADLLPVDWDKTTVGRVTAGKNQLRVTKIAALGYLGKDLLWAASPLMNEESTGATTYNKDFAKRAAEAFGELLNIVDGGNTQFGLIPFDEYSENFVTMDGSGKMPGQNKDNTITEAIFRGPTYCSGWGCSAWGQVKCYGGMDINDSGVTFMPTANYVNYYGMANGLPLDDSDSQFDKTHPWKDRDPRFYHDIKYDGCQMIVKEDDGFKDWRYADMQTNGKYRDEYRGTRTGYFNYKFVSTKCNKVDDGYGWSPQIHMHIPWMRLSDVYLMYAEAAAEATGSATGSVGCKLTAVDAVNKVRERAGVAAVADKNTASLDNFMSEVRRERAVELSFEGHRFNDLRRWLLLDKYPYNIKTSQEFLRVGDMNVDDPTKNTVAEWSEKVILKRNFSKKHYWLPLKKSDTTLYPEFGQNPGW